MACIKNGAKVYFENYGFVVPADVYRVGNCLVIRWNVNGRAFLPVDNAFPTHIVRIIVDSEEWMHREDLGITIVPESYVDTLV
jgi:hypothetical protein